MTDYVTAIIKLKPPYDADPVTALRLLAQFSVDTYGEGGNTEAQQVEDFIGWVNSDPRITHGYLRMRIGRAYGMALEFIEAHGGNPIAELIRVEWFGQDMVHTGTDDDGNPIIERVPFQTGTQDVVDEYGNVIDTVPVYLTGIAG